MAEITVLDNGFKVVSEKIDSVKTASVGVWSEIGSRHEDPSDNGISHFLEHMAFKGTTSRSAKEIAMDMEGVGGYLNAYTTREYTAYQARVLSKDLPLAMDILGDILQNSTYLEEEIEKERQVILQELYQANDTPDDLVFENLQKTAYPAQALGRSILGTEESINAVTQSNLQSFMDKYYRANRMMCVAAGDVNHSELVDLCHKYFRDFKRTNEILSFDPANYKGGEIFESRDVEQSHLSIGLKGIPQNHADHYAMAAFSNILGGGMSSRLFQEIRETRGLAYSIYSFHSAFLDDGLFCIYTGTSPDKVEEAKSRIFEVIDGMENVDEEELERNKTQLKAGLLMSLESTTSRCEQLAQQIMIKGRQVLPDELISMVDRVTIKDILRIKNNLLLSDASISCVGPGKK